MNQDHTTSSNDDSTATNDDSTIVTNDDTTTTNTNNINTDNDSTTTNTNDNPENNGLFYQSFLDLYKSNPEYDSRLKDRNFRIFLMNKCKRDFTLIKFISNYVHNLILKSQKLIHNDIDYYIAIDMITNTYYICYKHLLMIDIDFYKNDKCYDQQSIINLIQEYCNTYSANNKNDGLIFRLYQSRNGIHAFLLNKRMNYMDDNSIKLMLDLQCDFYYCIYAHLRGWCVRLNKKDKDNDILYTYIFDIRSESDNCENLTIDPHLEKLTNLHINLSNIFCKTTDKCMMYAG